MSYSLPPLGCVWLGRKFEWFVERRENKIKKKNSWDVFFEGERIGERMVVILWRKYSPQIGEKTSLRCEITNFHLSPASR